MWKHGPVTTIRMQLKGDQANVAVAVHVVEGEERVAIVDSGLVWAFSQLEAALEDGGIAKERVSLLLNTHEHMDHNGNNASLVS